MKRQLLVLLFLKFVLICNAQTPNWEKANLHVISRTPATGQPLCQNVDGNRICVTPEFEVEARVGKVHYTLLCSQSFVNGLPAVYSPACLAVKPGSDYPVEVLTRLITFKDSSPYMIYQRH